MTDRQTTHAADCWSWGPAHYECAVREIEILRAEVEKLRAGRAAQAEAEPRLFLTAEDDAWCAECGAKLESVRPGKHQHPTCSQAQPLTDEALLREALYALEYASDMTKPEDLQGCGCPICTNIAALRERLGDEKG